MQQAYQADKSLGYAQSASTAAVISVKTLFPGGVIPAGTAWLLIVAEGAARYRDDGTAPTTTVGMPLAANTPLQYTGSRLGDLQIIGTAGAIIVDVIAYSSGG